MISRLKSMVKSVLAETQKMKRRVNAQQPDQVIAQLNQIPIEEGDDVFVHTRLSTVGYFETSPDFIIDAILEKIGSTGNLFMPSFTSNEYAVDYLKKGIRFEPASTLSMMGVLTRLFMERKEVHRSIHPTHSVLGYGRKAKWVLESHHQDVNPFGELSPFNRFLALDQPKVLCLGLTMFPATIFRVYESMRFPDYPVPIFFDDPIPYKALVDGKEWHGKTLAHNPKASNIRRNMLFENQFLKDGRLVPYTIGASKSYLLDAKAFLVCMDDNFQRGNLPYIGHYKDFDSDNVDASRLQKTWELA